MARPRKKHVQQEFQYRRHGGKRPGAGRPPKGKRSSERHKKRAAIHARHPLHVTTRVVEGLGSLRKRDTYLAIRMAVIAVFLREGFRIIHFSIQGTHLHLMVEATDEVTLAKGMQAFLGSAAKRINRAILHRTGRRRRGKVFVDRYHANALTTPRQVRHALAYVLNNWRRHGEDRAAKVAGWSVDAYSSGVFFNGWAERASSATLFQPPATYEWPVTWLPRTWLLREGWKRHGLISLFDVPGPMPGNRCRSASRTT